MAAAACKFGHASEPSVRPALLRVGMGSRQSHSGHGGQPGMRNETVSAALAAAASLVIRRTTSSDQILQSRCESLEGGAQEIVPL